MKCSVCGKTCYDEQYPEVVFKDEKLCVCEKCSMDFEEIKGKVKFRQDLIAEGYVPQFCD